jgi:hypothetical protein
MEKMEEIESRVPNHKEFRDRILTECNIKISMSRMIMRRKVLSKYRMKFSKAKVKE